MLISRILRRSFPSSLVFYFFPLPFARRKEEGGGVVYPSSAALRRDDGFELNNQWVLMILTMCLRIQTWALEEARRRLEIEGILEDPFPNSNSSSNSNADVSADVSAQAGAEVEKGS